MSLRLARSPEAPKMTIVKGSLARISSIPGSVAAAPRLWETDAVSRPALSDSLIVGSPLQRKSLTRIRAGTQGRIVPLAFRRGLGGATPAPAGSRGAEPPPEAKRHS